MIEFLSGITHNKVLIIALISWVIAQSLKLVFSYRHEKRIDLGWLFRSGGMPSSHTTIVVALGCATGLENGWNSNIFALSVVFALIVMYDAAGVRRAAGKQAEVLNKIIEELYYNGQIGETRLKELIGHTPVEVFAGAILGAATALVIYYWW